MEKNINRKRALIENIRPSVDNGVYPVKREIGDILNVFADVFRDVEVLVAANEAAEKFVTTEKDLNYFAELRKNLAVAYGDKFKQITEN